MILEYIESKKELEELMYRAFNEGFRAGKDSMLNSIRASLQSWPNLGGDIEIHKSIEALCHKYYQDRKEKEWKEFVKNGD
ncbi:hypothetical protein UFOVP434_75 [uncultured Caudovirales phage]|uniref:Uncharacterized protein n=1 Tax=uncultured Caudovirales phage TaxID=2100421 RepID=A0A6J5M7P5_9CAUD|nr:hypothetical protein UFOVP434_75 [uncultured Caudovirales phage]